MENKIILFSNIKGGVGKTTLCALFATYLAEQGVPVFVLDADLQESLFRHRQREKDVDPDAQAPWGVEILDTSNSELLTETITKLKKVPGIVLIDCPGNLNDKNLSYIYSNADVAVIPMSFDPDTVDATGIFVKALKKVSPAQFIFAPNRINTSEGKAEELRQRAQTAEILSIIGTVLPRVKQTVAVKRYTTLYNLDKKQRDAVGEAFKRIVKDCNIK